MTEDERYGVKFTIRASLAELGPAEVIRALTGAGFTRNEAEQLVAEVQEELDEGNR